MPSKKKPTTIDDYIRTFPSNVRSLLEDTRQSIRDAAPGAAEAISYGIPTFFLNGKGLVSFAAWKHHIAMYAVPKGDKAFQREIAPYRAAKSTVQFPLGQPIPQDLVRRFVEFRMKEGRGKYGRAAKPRSAARGRRGSSR